MKRDDVSSFDMQRFKEDIHPIKKFTRHFVDSVETSAGFKDTGELFFDLVPKVLQVVLVVEVEVYSIRDFLFFGDYRSAIYVDAVVHPIDDFV